MCLQYRSRLKLLYIVKIKKTHIHTHTHTMLCSTKYTSYHYYYIIVLAAFGCVWVYYYCIVFLRPGIKLFNTSIVGSRTHTYTFTYTENILRPVKYLHLYIILYLRIYKWSSKQCARKHVLLCAHNKSVESLHGDLSMYLPYYTII